MGEEVRQLKSKYKQVVTEQPWGYKSQLGSGAAEEPIRMTHRHEQWWGIT